MAENKTKPTAGDVTAYLEAVEPAQRRTDGHAVTAMMKRISGEAPTLWGPSIIGFGSEHYQYESGRSGEMPRIAFSPRKAALVFYLSCDGAKREDLLARLGKHKTGKGCLYVNKLSDVDIDVLEELIAASWAE